METKQLPLSALELKFDRDMAFKGYASVFNGVDAYGDTIVPGAYKNTLTSRDRPIRMRWNHFGPVIGKWTKIEEDDKGLYVEGELTPGHSQTKDAYASLVHGAIDGLSIGYMVRDFEQKGENLHWFPMFRTWFGLNGLCKLPWNDVVPENNKQTKEPAKVIAHVENYAKLFQATTGKKTTIEDIINMSERVYNFQRIFNLRMGFGTREHDNVPYRSVGPVTKEEYESRQERYDKQLKEKAGYDPTDKPTEEKMAALRKYRELEYERLKDAVYKRRGWTQNGVPTPQKAKTLGIDFPDVMQMLQKHA